MIVIVEDLYIFFGGWGGRLMHKLKYSVMRIPVNAPDRIISLGNGYASEHPKM